MGDMVEVGSGELATVKADVKHMSERFDRMEQSQENMADAVVELKVIAQQGVDFNKSMHDRVLPKIDALERVVIVLEQEQKQNENTRPRVDNIEKWIHKKDAVIIAIVSAFTLFKDQIAGFLGL